MNSYFSHIIGSWKTTAVGFSAAIGVIANAVHFDSAGHLLMTEKDWFACFCAVTVAVVAAFQQDSGKQQSVTPADPTPKDRTAVQTVADASAPDAEPVK